MLRFYSREDPPCTLCESAWSLLTLLLDRYGMEVQRIDISGDPVLYDRFKHKIPAIEAPGGEILWGRIDREALVRFLDRAG